LLIMKLQLNGYVRKATDQQLLSDLRKAASHTRRNTISNAAYRIHGSYSPGVLMRRFGSWNNALQKAGLSVTKQYNIPAAALLQNIGTLWTALGRQPALSDLHPPLSRYGRRPYLRVFGKWSIALKKFVAHTSTIEQPQKTNHPSKIKTANIATNVSRTRPGTITWRLRHLIMKRDHFRCKICGTSPASDPSAILHIDHIIPLSKGGNSQPQNLQTLCATCNIGKGDL
jgi:5-methylcytosine-specific restriction endonuclease McrA